MQHDGLPMSLFWTENVSQKSEHDSAWQISIVERDLSPIWASINRVSVKWSTKKWVTSPAPPAGLGRTRCNTQSRSHSRNEILHTEYTQHRKCPFHGSPLSLAWLSPKRCSHRTHRTTTHTCTCQCVLESTLCTLPTSTRG